MDYKQLSMPVIELNTPSDAPIDMTKDVNVIIINPRRGGFCKYKVSIYEITKKTNSNTDYITRLQKELDEFNSMNLTEDEAINLRTNHTKILEAEINHRNGVNEYYKIKSLIYTSIIKKKNIENLITHLKSKLNASLGNCLEHTQELVELGHIKEDEYIYDADQAKDAYNSLEELIDYYNTAEKVIITNGEVLIMEDN